MAVRPSPAGQCGTDSHVMMRKGPISILPVGVDENFDVSWKHMTRPSAKSRGFMLILGAQCTHVPKAFHDILCKVPKLLMMQRPACTTGVF